MGKRRRVAKPEGPSGPREVDPSEARLKVKTYEDVADSEDEYFIEKDRIDFDDEPRSKKLRRQQKEDEFLEPSDEEVFQDDDDDDTDASEDEAPKKAAPAAKGKSKKAAELSDDDVERHGDEEDESGWWGSSRKDYYNADQIETEADALEEEAEARRLQQKKLAKMSEADFMFDENEWLAPSKSEGADEAAVVVTEVLKDVPVTEDMTPEDRYKLLQARYPEFDYLVDEFQTLQPLLAQCQKDADGKTSKSVETIKYWALGAYVASLASYFAILTSPVRDENGAQKTLDPAELREHDIMETLVTCREMWLKVQKLKAPKSAPLSNGMLSPPEEDVDMLDTAAPKRKTAEEKQAAKDAKAKKKKAAEKAKKAAAVEETLADLDDLLKKPKSAKATRAAQESAATKYTEDDARDRFSDFGEEEALDARTAADKEKRKKSLKFYTSQIVQKASKRANAGADAGGDADIPYRERLRDRQARLNAEAERRGKKDGKSKGIELGGDSDDEGSGRVAAELRDGADEYYDLVAQKSKQRREEKISRFEAVAAAKRGERIVEQEVVGEDGKRKITYAIDKNKGLAPRRKKEVRNPRVKKRMQYADKQKKLKSMKPVYKGGEGKGGYQGELSGIKTGLVKSVRL